MLKTARDELTSDEEKTISAALAALDEASKLLNDFLKEDWVSYQNKLANKQISLDTVIK
jgi:hypothetical protein